MLVSKKIERWKSARGEEVCERCERCEKMERSRALSALEERLLACLKRQQVRELERSESSERLGVNRKSN